MTDEKHEHDIPTLASRPLDVEAQVVQAWDDFRLTITAPAFVRSEHAHFGVPRESLDRLVGLATRSLGEMLDPNDLVRIFTEAHKRARLSDERPIIIDEKWAGACAFVLDEIIGVIPDASCGDRQRIEGIVAIFAVALLDPHFVDNAPTCLRGRLRETLDLVAAPLRSLGGERLHHLLSALTRRRMMPEDIIELEKLYGDLPPIPKRASPSEPTVALVPVKRQTIALALGVSERSITEWTKRPGFPRPLREGKRLIFDAVAVAFWAQRTGAHFDPTRLPQAARELLAKVEDEAALKRASDPTRLGRRDDYQTRTA